MPTPAETEAALAEATATEAAAAPTGKISVILDSGGVMKQMLFPH
jgi:hypothetical protein